MDENRTYRSLAELGDEIRQDRQNRGINIQAMASMTCTREGMLMAIESGEMPNVSTASLLSVIRNYLNVMGRKDLWPHYQKFLNETPLLTDPGVKEDPIYAHESRRELNDEEVELPKQPFNVPNMSEDQPTPRHIKPTDDVYSGRQAFRFDNLGPTMMEPHTFPKGQEKAEAAAQRRYAPMTEGEPHRRQPRVPKVEPTAPRAAQPRRRRVVEEEPIDVITAAAPTVQRQRRVPRSNSPLLMNELGRADQEPQRRRPWGALILGLLTLIVLLVLAFLVWRATHRIVGSEPTNPTTAIEAPVSGDSQDLGATVVTVPEHVVSVTPVEGDSPVDSTVTTPPQTEQTEPSTTTTQEPAVAGAAAGKLAVKIDGGECWVKVTKGGKVIFGKVMKSGDIESFDLDADLAVKFGAAQHATVSVDGAAFEEPGKGVLTQTYKAVR